MGFGGDTCLHQNPILQFDQRYDPDMAIKKSLQPVLRHFIIAQPAGAIWAVAGACARRAAFAANPPAVSVQLHQPAFFTLEADAPSCNPVRPDQGAEHGLAEGDHLAQFVRMDTEFEGMDRPLFRMPCR